MNDKDRKIELNKTTKVSVTDASTVMGEFFLSIEIEGENGNNTRTVLWLNGAKALELVTAIQHAVFALQEKAGHEFNHLFPKAPSESA